MLGCCQAHGQSHKLPPTPQPQLFQNSYHTYLWQFSVWYSHSRDYEGICLIHLERADCECAWRLGWSALLPVISITGVKVEESNLINKGLFKHRVLNMLKKKPNPISCHNPPYLVNSQFFQYGNTTYWLKLLFEEPRKQSSIVELRSTWWGYVTTEGTKQFHSNAGCLLVLPLEGLAQKMPPVALKYLTAPHWLLLAGMFEAPNDSRHCIYYYCCRGTLSGFPRNNSRAETLKSWLKNPAVIKKPQQHSRRMINGSHQLSVCLGN